MKAKGTKCFHSLMRNVSIILYIETILTVKNADEVLISYLVSMRDRIKPNLFISNTRTKYSINKIGLSDMAATPSSSQQNYCQVRYIYNVEIGSQKI